MQKSFSKFWTSCGLEIEVKITKIKPALKLVLMIFPCKFGEIPPTCSRDNMGTRSGMPTLTPPLVGGHSYFDRVMVVALCTSSYGPLSMCSVL